MKIGIFAKTFSRPTVEEVFDAVSAHNLHLVQFNLSCAGVSTLPDEIDAKLIQRIREAAQHRNIEIAAVSGTYNMIHPDVAVQKNGLRRLRILADACHDLGTNIITLCTGTRDADDMWRWHPENTSQEAWTNLLHAMEAALRIAEEKHVTLAIEPEHANVVSSAERGRALLNAIRSPHLKVIIDPANIIASEEGQVNDEILQEAFELLGYDIVIAHAKDKGADNTFKAAGKGLVNYALYLNLLQAMKHPVPLILHGLSEKQVDFSVQFITNQLQAR